MGSAVHVPAGAQLQTQEEKSSSKQRNLLYWQNAPNDYRYA
ncbi:MAG: hypothetical protein AAFQ74_07205 [Cyanobacteria bacterium J06623_4]